MGLSGYITPWRRENGQALGNHALIQIMIKIFEHKIYLEMGKILNPLVIQNKFYEIVR